MEKRDPRTVVAVILGGGAGTRLFPLTKQRAKPAVFIGCFESVLIGLVDVFSLIFH